VEKEKGATAEEEKGTQTQEIQVSRVFKIHN